MSDRGSLLFQLAATLIPVFLLAVAATDVFNPKRVVARHPAARVPFAVFLMVSVAFVLVAEALAIELSFANDRSAWKEAVVVEALLFLVVATGAAILWPWVRIVWRGRVGKWVLSGLALPSVVVGVFLLGLSLVEAVGETELAAERRQGSCVAAWVRTRVNESERRLRERVDRRRGLLEKLARENARQDGLVDELERLSESRSLTPQELARRRAAIRRELRTSREISKLYRDDAIDVLFGGELDLVDPLLEVESYAELVAAAGC